MRHVLFRAQMIHAPIEKVWEYFFDPRNLNALTPPDMNFEIVTKDLPHMYEGQLIEYRVEFIRGLRSPWLTEISHVRDQSYFVDEQRIGPYRFWYHEHRFEAVEGGVRMTDRVTYDIGFGLIGEALHTLWIEKRLCGIFDFRVQTINKIFGGAK